MKIQTQRHHIFSTRSGLLVCFAALAAAGATWVVSPRMASATTRLVPSQYSTIQAGIAAAQVGDTVLVAAGIYTGVGNHDLDFDGKGILLLSEAGAASTTIDCAGMGRGLYFHNAEDTTAVVDGFTIINGSEFDGAGVEISSSSPKIRNTTITTCIATSAGGGIHIVGFCSPIIVDCTVADNHAFSSGGIDVSSSSTPVIKDCTISGNRVTANSAGIGVVGSPLIMGCTINDNRGPGQGGGLNIAGGASPTITNCTITGDSANAGGGILIQDTSTPTITNCLISENMAFEGAGVEIWDSPTPMITSCTITGNYASNFGGGVSVASFVTVPIVFGNCTIAGNRSGSAGGGVFTEGPSLTLDKTVVWNNCAMFGPETYMTTATDSMFFDCSDIDSSGVEGTGAVFYDANTIFVDPLFCGPIVCTAAPVAGGAYSLDDDSPCLATNSPCAALIGAKPQGCTGRTLDVVDDGYPTIQAAIDVAVSGVGDTVVVADSVWTGTGNTALDFTGKNIVLKSKNGPVGTIIDGQGTARGIAFTSGEGPTAVVDGFTLRRGNPALAGSAILVDSTSSPVIKNCLILDTVGAFGVVYIAAGAPTLSFCSLKDDTSTTALGILAIVGGAPTIEDCLIQNNSATNTVTVTTASTITGTSIIDNSGSGVYFDSAPSSVINACDISRNGGRGAVLDSSSAVFSGVIFQQNGDGGVIVTGLTSPGSSSSPSDAHTSANATSTTDEFIDCEFSGHSTDRGAGFLFDCTNEPALPYTVTFTNCRFSGNHATFEGGGIAICGRATNADITLLLTGCTIAANSAQVGGGVDMGVTDIGIGRTAQADVELSILWGNCSPDSVRGEAYVMAGNELFIGCSHTSVDEIAGTGLVDTTDVTTGIPAFCDYPGTYYGTDCQTSATIAGDFDLAPESPAAPANHPCGPNQIGAFPVVSCVATGVEDEPVLPSRTVLDPPAPNPFNPVTTIAFTLAASSHVTLRIYDVQGRLVRTLLDRQMPHATHRLTWDGVDARGNHVATGVYFLRLTSGNTVRTQKMVLLK